MADLKMSDYGITPDEFPKMADNAMGPMGGLFACDRVALTKKTLSPSIRNHINNLLHCAERIVRCPPGVKHWHGGSAKMSMTHIALSEAGGTVTWLEPVSDEDYPKD